MDIIKQITDIEVLKNYLQFFDEVSYLYAFFGILFLIIFLLISYFSTSKKSKNKEIIERKKPNLDEIVDKRDIKISDDNEFVDVLVAIEEEMTAIRELYVGGYISKGVYISETDRLYEKAKIFGI